MSSVSKILSLLKRELQLIIELRIKTLNSEEKITPENLINNMFEEIFGNNFTILLGLATIIATFGLLSNSTATIIGGMIVAPLIIPIMSFSYALVILNFRLLTYSLGRLIYGILFTIILAYICTDFIGFRIAESEILARTQPTLLDLGVAMAAGSAGAFAKINRSVSDAIPGVAIAVALVPPLCVVGIGLAVNDFSLITGSFLLFITNFIGIVLSALFVFLFKSYGSWRKAVISIFFLFTSVFIITRPLNFSFREMILENKIRHAVYPYDIRYSEDGNIYISSVEVKFKDDQLWVILDVIIPPQRLEQANFQSKEVQEILRKNISDVVGVPIYLRVRYLPVGIVEKDIKPPL